MPPPPCRRHFVALWAAAAVAASGADCGDVSLVLPPPPTAKAELPERLLVLIPGGKVPNAHYAATAAAVQRSVSQAVRLWATIPAVLGRLCVASCPAPLACAPLRHVVESTLQRAEQQGWARSRAGGDIWLVGHSLGGVCANTLFKAWPAEAPPAGLILLGSYVDESGAHSLVRYPAPVLMVNGELDGLTRPGKTATWWRQHLEVAKASGGEYAVSTKPVVVLPRVNHSAFCPGFDVKGDLPGEVASSEATAAIAQTAAAFILLHTQAGGSAAEGPLEVLRQGVARTAEFLNPYLVAQSMEVSGATATAEGMSSMCMQAQHLLAGLAVEDDARLQVTDAFHASLADLGHCSPSCSSATGGIVSASTCSHVDYYTDVANLGEITAAKQIACKMQPGERIAAALAAPVVRPGVGCEAANRRAVEVAESLATNATLRRYRAKGRGVCLLEDIPSTGSEHAWEHTAQLQLSATETCLAVASPVFRAADAHHCKVLSPARVLDWMMTDSLRPPQLPLRSVTLFV